MTQSSEERYKQRQQRLKEKVEQRIAKAQQQRGIIMIFTGNGKGKSTAAFGTVARAIGHGLHVAVVQFIKGNWDCGERDLFIQQGVEFQVMASGFTWQSQDRHKDKLAALAVWQHAKRMLSSPQLDLVVLDELTYMINYDYLSLEEILQTLIQRPAQQSVIITGRGCHRQLIELADTVSEIRPVKHAFDAGIKAQKGIDW